MSSLPQKQTRGPEHQSSGLAVAVFAQASEASQAVADEIAKLIRQRAAQGRMCVLGLATGSTPIRVYRELIRVHREEGLSLNNVVTFNLDEYFPMQPDAQQSYVRFMNENLFEHVDIRAENIHIPDGAVAPQVVADYCRGYEEQIAEAGGIDLQLLGIGRNGHIGFNEPGSCPDSLTRLVTLDSITRDDAAGDFGGPENVPPTAITMGVKTIFSARRIRLLAFGQHKSAIIQRAIEGDVSKSVPASFLQTHPEVRFFLDLAAAEKLSDENRGSSTSHTNVLG